MHEIALIGAGNRGRLYTGILKRLAPDLRVTSVADPREARRSQTATVHGIRLERQFDDWRPLIDSLPEGPSQAVIIATGDQDHVEPACAALSRGHHVLLEKPMAPDLAGIRAVQAAAVEAQQRGGSLTVCHVLRYDPLFRFVRQTIEQGHIGRVVSLYHAENVSWYHMAHSYVRGQWRNAGESSPMILAKSCHDLDLLCWFVDSAPVTVAATAAQSVFTPANAPAGAPARCTDGCPVADSCRYEAVRTYHDGIPIRQALARGRGLTGAAARFSLRYPGLSKRLPVLSRYAPWREWPTSTITDDLSSEGILNALRHGPHGQCVYRSDNTQPDHLEAVIQFESGVSAAFRMHGQSSEEGRSVRIDGTEGTLHARFGRVHEVRVHRHGSSLDTLRRFPGPGVGHRTADIGLIRAWAAMIRGEAGFEAPDLAVRSHVLALAIHEASERGATVSI